MHRLFVNSALALKSSAHYLYGGGAAARSCGMGGISRVFMSLHTRATSTGSIHHCRSSVLNHNAWLPVGRVLNQKLLSLQPGAASLAPALSSPSTADLHCGGGTVALLGKGEVQLLHPPFTGCGTYGDHPHRSPTGLLSFLHAECKACNCPFAAHSPAHPQRAPRPDLPPRVIPT